MVSIISKTGLEANTTLFTFAGLSTDTKPTGDNIQNGSTYIEMNTGKLFFYDAEGAAGEEWKEWA